jgi:hypothetical protein
MADGLRVGPLTSRQRNAICRKNGRVDATRSIFLEEPPPKLVLT